jgi:hypothetical protein
MYLYDKTNSRKSPSWITLIASILLSALWPLNILGADEPDKSESGNPAFSVKFSVESIGRAGIDGTDASFAFTEYSASLTWQFMILDFDHRKVNWSAGNGLGSSADRDPWGDLTRIAPGLQYYGELSDRWGLWLKMVAISGFEDRISSRSWTYNPQVIGFYRAREHLTLYLVLAHFSIRWIRFYIP